MLADAPQMKKPNPMTLTLSVRNVLQKLQGVAPAPNSQSAANRGLGASVSTEARVTGQKVAELIATATSVNVCLMPPTWHPWF